MDVPMAVRALRNISRLVTPHGYLSVSGVNLEVRTNGLRRTGMEAGGGTARGNSRRRPLHESFWPCHYGGLEPLNKRMRDWRRRYAAAFQLIPTREEAGNSEEPSMATEDGRGGSVERRVPAMAFAAGDTVRLSASC